MTAAAGYRSPLGWTLALGAGPVVALYAPARTVVLLAAAWRLTRLVAPEPAEPDAPPVAAPRFAGLLTAMAIVAVSAPFAVSVGAGQSGPTGGPPAQVMARRTDPFTYSIRLVGQSPELEVAWVEAQGNQRHHTLPICMQYRGIALQDTAVAGVMTDGGQWLREFFLRDGQLIDTYRSYALSTLLPGTEPGVHIIIAAPRRNLGAEAFAVQASSVARRLVDLAG